MWYYSYISNTYDSYMIIDMFLFSPSVCILYLKGIWAQTSPSSAAQSAQGTSGYCTGQHSYLWSYKFL